MSTLKLLPKARIKDKTNEKEKYSNLRIITNLKSKTLNDISNSLQKFE